MFKAVRQATRQPWGLAFVMAVEVGQMHGQDLFVAALENSPKLRLEGGCLEMAQRVVGVPWNQCTLSSWGRFSNKKASEWSAGIHLQSPNVRGSFWFGRVVGGGWTSARHVEGTWKNRERWAMGLVAMEGQGRVTGAYAMVPNLDGRIWSLVPREGGRMGIWFSQKKSNRSWVSQWTWSPSQQEAFRCALRWRWEGEPNRGILPRR